MPILAKSPSGTVTGLWGSAYVRLPSGKLKALKVGDQVKSGEQIVTTQDGIVQITNPKGKVAEVKPVAPAGNDVDRAIAAIENDELDAATAAGLRGGADGGLQPGLRVDRVREDVGPQSFQFDTGRGLTRTEFRGDEKLQIARAVAPAQVTVNDVVVDEDAGTAVFTITLSRASATPVTITFFTQSGTATAGDDFEAVTRTVVIPAGERTVQVSVPIVDDQSLEPNETFSVVITSTSANAVVVDGTGIATIVDDNSAPVAQDDEAYIDFAEDGTPQTLVVSAQDGVIQGEAGRDSDPDLGDTLTVTAVRFGEVTGVVGQPLVGEFGTLTLNADGSYTYVPSDAAITLPQGEGAEDLFTYTVTDSAGNSSTANLSVRAVGVNDAPIAQADTYYIEGTVAEVSVAAAEGVLAGHVEDEGSTEIVGTDVDPDGDALVVLKVAVGIDGPLNTDAGTAIQGAYGTLILRADGSFSYAPNAAALELPAGEAVEDLFRYSVSDGQGGVSETTLSIRLLGTPDGPVAVDDVARTQAGEAVVIDVLRNDQDADAGDQSALTVVAIDNVPFDEAGRVTISGKGTFVRNGDGTLTFTPAEGLEGPVTFEYTVEDPSGLRDVGLVAVTVRPDNMSPAASDDEVTTDEGKLVVIDVLANDSDADDDDLVITEINGDSIEAGQSVTLPGQGSITLGADGKLTFQPEPGYVGPVTFEYTVTDGTTPVTASVNVSVKPVNDAPVVNDDITHTPAGVAVTVDVLGNDVDPDGDTLRLVSINGDKVAAGDVISLVTEAGAPMATLKVTADGRSRWPPLRVTPVRSRSATPQPIRVGCPTRAG